MVGHLPEPGSNPDDYAVLKERLKTAYAKSEMERCAKLMLNTSLGDRSPEHLLSYMQGLMPAEIKSALFRYIWLTALPDSIHQVLSADDSELPVLAAKATRMLKEKIVKKKRIEQVNAIKLSSQEDLEEVDAVSGGAAKAKMGVVCANHLRFPGNCFKCFEPERCLFKDALIPRPVGSSNSKKKSGNFRAGPQ